MVTCDTQKEKIAMVDGDLALKDVERTGDFSDISVKSIEGSGKKQVGFFYIAIKRAFDFASSFALSIVLLVPMAIIALIIVAKDFGNPFYVQKRVGQNGSELRVVKFRSMKKGADHLEEMLTTEQLEEYHREYKLEDDPRLLGWAKPGDGKKCFGAFIRRMSLDELPQILFNICLKGNMSVVGPRPILQEEIEENYTSEQKKLLLSVKPGLTGYWQAYARNNATYMTGVRQEMELYYIQNQSLWLDIKILFATVGAVLKGRGAK